MPSLTVVASIDSYITPVQPNANFGADTSVIHGVLYAGANKVQWRRGIGNFNVSALVGAVVLSAKLVREVTSVIGAGGVLARLSRCTRPADWVETQVTWNNYRNGSPWTNGGGDFDDATPPKIDYAEPSATGAHEVPGLKPFVDDALANRGGLVSIITRLVGEGPGVTQEVSWRSREQGSSGWRLVVEYEVPNAGRRSASPPAHRGARPARAVRPATGAQAGTGVRPVRLGRVARPGGHRPRRDRALALSGPFYQRLSNRPDRPEGLSLRSC